MNQQTEKGSAHVVLVAVLVLIIIGLIGILFWQNVMNKESATSDTQSSAKTETTQQPTTAVDPIVATKVGIEQSLNTEGYAGLSNYMAAAVDSAIANSDGIFNDKTPDETTKSLDTYFTDYASWNKQTKVSEWKTEEFNVTNNTKLKNFAAQTTFFDFKGTYVAVGAGSNDDKFMAFHIDDQGKITYVFYGSML